MSSEEYRSLVEELRTENEYLKDQNKRLNTELRKCQLALGQDATRLPEVSSDAIPPWAVNAVYLAPLLLAYDNRIQELESSLERSRNQFDLLSDRAQRLVRENGELREEMERKWKEMLERQKNEIEGGLGFSMLNEERHELQERVELLTEENQLMLSQLEEYKSEHEDLVQRAKDRELAAEKYLSQLKQVVHEVNTLRTSEDQLRTHRQIAEENLKRANEVLGNLEMAKETLTTRVNELENDLRHAHQEREHYKRAYEEVDSKKTAEIEMLRQEAQSISIREREALNRSVVQERELDEAREEASKNKRDLDATRQELDGLLKILEEMEQKIAMYQQKEESFQLMAKDARQQAEEALLEKDRIKLRENNILKQISKLQDQLKYESMENKKRSDALLDGIRQKHRAVLNGRDEELKELQDKVANLGALSEKLQRDNTALIAENERVGKLLYDEQDRIDRRLNEYDRKFREAEENRLLEKRLLEEQAYNYSSERQEWDVYKKRSESMIHNLQKDLDHCKSTAQRNKEEANRLRLQTEELSRERDTLVVELNQLRDVHYDKISQVTQNYNNRIAALEHEISEARERQRESEERAYELLRAQEKISEKWKQEHKQTVAYFERVVSEMNEDMRRSRTDKGRVMVAV